MKDCENDFHNRGMNLTEDLGVCLWGELFWNILLTDHPNFVRMLSDGIDLESFVTCKEWTMLENIVYENFVKEYILLL